MCYQSGFLLRPYTKARTLTARGVPPPLIPPLCPVAPQWSNEGRGVQTMEGCAPLAERLPAFLLCSMLSHP